MQFGKKNKDGKALQPITAVRCQACGKHHNHSDAHETDERTQDEALAQASCHHCGAVGKLKVEPHPSAA